MDCLEFWFFALFYGLPSASYYLYSSELTCIGCIAQIPSCFYAWNSVLSLLRTQENFSSLLLMKSSDPWFFACFYWLLGTLCLCLFLWTARNPASLPAFMKSSEPWFISFHKFWCPRVMKIPIGWNLEKNSLGCFFINWLLEKFVKLSCEMWKSIRINL